MANSAHIKIERDVLSQVDLNERWKSPAKEIGPLESVKNFLTPSDPITLRTVGRFIAFYIPMLQWLPQYKIRKSIPADLVAGITVGIINIPQGMAYGALCGLPPVYGLYTSLFPVLAYAVFGSSRHVAMGTWAVISLMVSAVIDTNLPKLVDQSILDQYHNLSLNESIRDQHKQFIDDASLEIAVSLSMITGLFMIGFGVLKLGFVTYYMSDQLVQGLLSAAAINVVTSQVTTLLGLQNMPNTDKLYGIIDYFTSLFGDAAIVNSVVATIITSIICITIMAVFKEHLAARVKKLIRFPFPIELLVIIVATGISYGADFKNKYHMEIVGHIPTGLPTPSVPRFDLMSDMIPDAIAISIVCFSVAVSLAKLFAKKEGYTVSANQEWLGFGISQVFCSFFSCHCVGTSLSRSSIQHSQGGKTQVASLFSCVLLIIVLLVAASLFETLPKCVLASIICVNLKGMLWHIKEVPPLWRASKLDALIWIVTFVAVILLDISLGLGVGVGFSLIVSLVRTQWLTSSGTKGQIDHTDIFIDSEHYKVKDPAGVKVFHFDSSLYFANAELFKQRCYEAVGIDPNYAKKRIAKEKKREAKKLQTVKFDRSNCSLVSLTTLNDRTNENSTVNLVGLSQVESKADLSGRVELTPMERKMAESLRGLIVDCSAVAFVDLMGSAALKELWEEFALVNVTVAFAACPDSVVRSLQKFNFFKRTDKDKKVPMSNFYPTVNDAIYSLNLMEKA